MFAFAIAGILLRYSEGASKVAHDLAGRLAAERGDEFARLAGATIRSVAQGVAYDLLLARAGVLAVLGGGVAVTEARDAADGQLDPQAARCVERG